jgi:uncharacterized membrane protein
MDATMSEWLNLAVRWLHVITGIAWIGSSFFFNWLDSHLEKPPTPRERVEGELWMVHSGGFYHISKMQLTPAEIPATLHWVKWEAGFTWISGFLLLAIVYYLGAREYLIDPSVADLSPAVAIAISVGSLIVGWLIYDVLWRSPLAQKPVLASAISFVLAVAAAYAFSKVFSGRAAYIQMGALLGTIMAANVWMIIIPSQQVMVAAAKAGTKPDPAYAYKAKHRSLHNNYMTLPVVFIMFSSHYPSTFGHELNWLILAGLGLVGGIVRHVFNLRNNGKSNPWLFPAAALGMIALAIVANQRGGSIAGAGGEKAEFAEVRAVIAQRCVTCHSAHPTDENFTSAPLGFVLDTPQQVRRGAQKINARTIITQTMPLANKTEMTDDERALLGRWIAQGARVD